MNDLADMDFADYVEQVLAPRHDREVRFANAGTPYLDPKVVTELRSALASIPSDDRDIWIKIGLALATLGDTGRWLFIEWSQKSEKYDARDTERVWKSFRPKNTSHEVVFAEAQARGWVNPMSNAAQGIAPATPAGVPSAGLPFDPFAGAYTAAELRDMDLPPLKAIVPGLLHAGLTVLAGLPKVGKSFFNFDLADAASVGGRFLGQQCHQCRVLYLALEDGQRRLQARQDDMVGDAHAGSDKLHIVHDWPRLNEGGLEALDAWCDRYPDLGLIQIDTLAYVAPAKKARAGNAYEQDVEGLKPLQRFAQERGIAVLVTTHFRKSRDGGDILERVTGSIGITGTADAITTIGDDTAGFREIYVRGREVKEKYYVARIVKSRWELVDGSKIETGAGDTQTAILEALSRSREPLSLNDLSATEQVARSYSYSVLPSGLKEENSSSAGWPIRGDPMTHARTRKAAQAVQATQNQWINSYSIPYKSRTDIVRAVRAACTGYVIDIIENVRVVRVCAHA